MHARILALTELLIRHPLIGVRTDDRAIRRVTVMPYPYLIFYEATADAVIIHAVRHGARNPKGQPGARSR